MIMSPDLNLRLEFTRTRTLEKLYKDLNSSPVFDKYVHEKGDDYILLTFKSKEARDTSLSILVDKLKQCKVKYTKYGHPYLKIVK